MKTRKTVLLAVLAIILVSNMYPVNVWTDTFLDQDYYAYSNGDGTSTHIYNAFQGGEFYMPKYLSTTTLDPAAPRMDTSGGYVEIPAGAALRKRYPNADTVMYRLFWKNPLTFWRWKYYILGNEKYDYPYQSWKEILSRRSNKTPDEGQEF